MIPTVPIDLLLNFLLGLVFAIVAGDAVTERGLKALLPYPLLFAVVVFAPIGFVLFGTHPDWSLMYLVPFGGASSWAWAIPVSLSYVAAHLLGFVLGGLLIASEKLAVVIGLAVATGLALVAVQLALFTELMHVGTREQFLAGGAVLLPKSKVFLFLLVVTPLFAGTVGWILWRFDRFRKEAME